MFVCKGLTVLQDIYCLVPSLCPHQPGFQLQQVAADGKQALINKTNQTRDSLTDTDVHVSCSVNNLDTDCFYFIILLGQGCILQ